MPSKETRADALGKRLKNHRILAPIIIGVLVLAVAVPLVLGVDELWTRFWPQNRIFAQCQYGVMPAVMPPEGRVHVLTAMELPPETGGGLADFFGRPGSEWKWTNDGEPSWSYRCELTNYSSDVLINVSVPVRLTFRTPMPVPGQQNARRQGDVTLDRNWVFVVPKLDPAPAAPYVFYVWNSSVKKFVQVRLPESVSTDSGSVPLVQPGGNLGQVLNPVPFN